MAGDSVPKKLTRVRPARVQILHDLQVGAAIEAENLPFVPSQTFDSMPKLVDRRFVDVNSDNFDSVLERCGYTSRWALKTS